MKRVSKLIVGLVALSAMTGVADEYGYIYEEYPDQPAPIVLNAGDKLEVLTAWGFYNSAHQPHVKTTVIFPDGKSQTYVPNIGISTFCGPCTVTFANYVDSGYVYVNYRIVRASDNSISPSNVISLPADVNGDMQLVFESSDDLLTWTQEFSFTHNSTNSGGKFFRTRLVQGSGE